MTIRSISREEWLAMRRESLGASEAAAACGEDPSVSPAELVCRKRGEIPEPDLSNVEAVQWGLLLEPAIVGEAARRSGLELLPPPAIDALFAGDPETELVGFIEGKQPFLRSRARPWQTATPDGVGFDARRDAHVAIEAKNQGQYHSGAWDTDGEAPDRFKLQVAHQLAVAPRLAGGILAGLVGGNSLRTVRLERVTIVAVIDALVSIEEGVWSCVKTGRLPELTGPQASVARALKALHPDDNGETVILPESVAAIAKQYEALREARKGLDEKIESCANMLRAAIGSATYGALPDGTGAYSLKTQERAGYTVAPSKFRALRFSKSKLPSLKG